jgi:hypothetical protein
MHTLITFLVWYMYFKDHVIFIEVHVPSQESDQCVY